jgi:hypothetical protein
MYDAVNRGLRKAQAGIVAYLNCDHQYLPGALARVVDFFKGHPAVDVLFADMIVVEPDGTYRCHREAMLSGKYHTQVSGTLAFSTCGTFFPQRILEERSLYFSESSRQ